jgi:hypothetical protein
MLVAEVYWDGSLSKQLLALAHVVIEVPLLVGALPRFVLLLLVVLAVASFLFLFAL